MRIISGTARGTKLYTLDGIEITRPTLDRVKESMFNIINSKIEDSVVLDLFAGCGAIGLEFASRGAKIVILCDNSKLATNIIRKNIEKTHLEKKVILYEIDYLKCIERIQEELDIIYLDPPYKTNYIINAINKLIDLNKISKNTSIIVETDDGTRIEEEIKKITQIEVYDKRKYGRAYILFLKLIDDIQHDDLKGAN